MTATSPIPLCDARRQADREVTGWLLAAAIAELAGKPMSNRLFVETSVHLLAVTPTRHWLEYLDLAGPILQEPLEVVNGVVQAPDRPGIGLAWDVDAVRSYRAET